MREVCEFNQKRCELKNFLFLMHGYNTTFILKNCIIPLELNKYQLFVLCLYMLGMV